MSPTTPLGQQIVSALDIINYFLDDFYFQYNVTHIVSIYFCFEEELMFMQFPGGHIYDHNEYNCTSREWFHNIKQLYIHGTITNNLNLLKEIIITGPYYDYRT